MVRVDGDAQLGENMTAFSLTDVALSGLRFTRAHPRSVVFWGLLQLAVSMVVTALMVKILGPAMSTIGGSSAGAAAAMGKALAFDCVAMPVVLIHYAIAAAAACRATFTPEQSLAGYLRLGKDELRQSVLFLLLGVLLFGVCIALAVAAAIPVVALAVAIPALRTAVIVALPMLVLAGVAMFTVRLSLASPLTYDLGKVKLWASWKLTRGHFWKILGAYMLAFLLSLAITALVSVVAFAAAALFGAGTDWASFVFKPDVSSEQTYFTLPRIVFMTISAFGGGLTLPLVWCPPVEIYRRLRDAPPIATSA